MRTFILLTCLLNPIFINFAPAQDELSSRWQFIEEEAKGAGETRLGANINLSGCWRESSTNDVISISQSGTQLRAVRPLQDASGNKQNLVFLGDFNAGTLTLRHNWTLDKFLDYDYDANDNVALRPLIRQALQPVSRELESSYRFRIFKRPKDEIAGVKETIAMRGIFLLANYWVHKDSTWDASGGLLPKGWTPDWKIEKVPDHVGTTTYWYRQTGSELKVTEVTITDQQYTQALSTIQPGQRFWIRARTAGGCAKIRDIIEVIVYPEGQQSKGIKVSLLETGEETLLFHSPSGGVLVNASSEVKP